MKSLLTISQDDLLAAVQKAAAVAVADLLADEASAAERERLKAAASCVSLEEVARLWSLTPRAASAALQRHRVPTIDMGHRSPRYRLQDVLAVVDPRQRMPRVRAVIIEGGD